MEHHHQAEQVGGNGEHHHLLFRQVVHLDGGDHRIGAGGDQAAAQGLLQQGVEAVAGAAADALVGGALGHGLQFVHVVGAHAASARVSLVFLLIRSSPMTAPMIILPPACRSWKVVVVIKSFWYRLAR